MMRVLVVLAIVGAMIVLSQVRLSKGEPPKPHKAGLIYYIK
jgi:hypothetical protein